MFQKMMMFAASLASRGIGNKKTDIQTKQLRVLSCFGGHTIDTPCIFLKTSSNYFVVAIFKIIITYFKNIKM